MNTLFRLNLPDAAGDSRTLLCEWGEHHCCSAAYNESQRTLTSLQYTAFDKPASAAQILDLLSSVCTEGQEFDKVWICLAYPQALLVPRHLFSPDKPLLPLVHPQNGTQHFHDPIHEWQVVNTYAFPQELYRQATDRFGQSSYIHYYTVALKSYNGVAAASQVAVDVTPKNVRVVVKKEGRLQLAQTYGYTTPYEVVYFLLKIYQELALNKEETPLILSGLIEEDSALFSDLNSYFPQVLFAAAQGIPLAGNPHPGYFFTSMSNLAACVS